jgi:PPOX class probable F420-dependent enzyme
MTVEPITGPVREDTAGGRTADGIGALVLVTVLGSALLMLVAGGWALVSSATFADLVGFDRAGEHFLHDAGAFQLGLGAGLLFALMWRDPLAVVLGGFLVANTVHAVNHAADLHAGGRVADVWLLTAWSVVVGAALLRRVRDGGWVLGKVSSATAPAFAPLRTQKTVVLTTWRRSGIGVPTPVSVAVDGDRAVFRTFARAGKTQRLRRDPLVTVAPSNARGRVSGPAVTARARLLDGPDARQAARLLRRKYPLLHGLVVPLAHRLLRRRVGRTIHFELVSSGCAHSAGALTPPRGEPRAPR